MGKIKTKIEIQPKIKITIEIKLENVRLRYLSKNIFRGFTK